MNKDDIKKLLDAVNPNGYFWPNMNRNKHLKRKEKIRRLFLLENIPH
jgi:hypothetical protein